MSSPPPSPEGRHPGEPPFGDQPPWQQHGQQPHGQQPHHGPQSPYGQQPPHGQQQPYGQPPYHGPQPSGDDRTIAVLAHLSPLIAMLISFGWLSFLGPLIVWIVWRHRGPLVRNAAASAFNFNVTVWVVSIVGWLLAFTLVLIPLSIVLWIAAFVAQVVLSIKGAVRANRGEVYRYPWQVPILS